MSNLISTSATLVNLAVQINSEHEQAEASLRAGLRHARRTGELLLEAKAQVGHGQWLSWLKANVRFSERTSQAYMRVARKWPELEAKAQGLAHLTFEDGLNLLAQSVEPSITKEYVRVGKEVFHTPFDLFPDIVGHRWESFKASVRDHGFQVPVITDEHRNVIDGRQRLRAAAELGIENVPIDIRAGLSDEEKLDFHFSVNYYRTSYSDDQIAYIEAEVAEERAKLTASSK